jgi:hypothetical protein
MLNEYDIKGGVLFKELDLDLDDDSVEELFCELVILRQQIQKNRNTEIK